MFYVEIENGLIVCKGEGKYKTDKQIEISEIIYNTLTSLPSEYTEENGVIVGVNPLPIPKVSLTPTELRQQAYETNPLIEWEDENITVDQANTIFLRYFAESNLKAEEIQMLIISAKDSIRQTYPDLEE